MSKLKRFHKLNDTCFVTSVTKRRHRLFDNVYSPILIDTFNKYEAISNFNMIAYAILPDHFHALIECNKSNLSAIMKRIKLSFSKTYRNRNHMSSGKIWQHRYWDHIVRDEVDLKNHIDYIHYNPVKHGYVTSPFDCGIARFTNIKHIIRMIGDRLVLANMVIYMKNEIGRSLRLPPSHTEFVIVVER